MTRIFVTLALLTCVPSLGCVASGSELALLTMGGDAAAGIELRERHRSDWEPALIEELAALGALDARAVVTKLPNYGKQRPLAGQLGDAPGLFLITHFVAGVSRLNDDWQWVCLAFLFTPNGGLDGTEAIQIPDRDLIRDPRLELAGGQLRVLQGGRVLRYRRAGPALVPENQ